MEMKVMLDIFMTIKHFFFIFIFFIHSFLYFESKLIRSSCSVRSLFDICVCMWYVSSLHKEMFILFIYLWNFFFLFFHFDDVNNVSATADNTEHISQNIAIVAAAATTHESIYKKMFILIWFWTFNKNNLLIVCFFFCFSFKWVDPMSHLWMIVLLCLAACLILIFYFYMFCFVLFFFLCHWHWHRNAQCAGVLTDFVSYLFFFFISLSVKLFNEFSIKKKNRFLFQNKNAQKKWKRLQKSLKVIWTCNLSWIKVCICWCDVGTTFNGFSSYCIICMFNWLISWLRQ